MKKHIMSVILSIVMLVTLLPITTLAADEYDLYIGGVGLPSGS